MDIRVERLAHTLVHYCIGARSGDTVSVNAGPLATPLICAVYEALLRQGAYPMIRMQPDELQEIFYRFAKPHHLTRLPPYMRSYAREVDRVINIYSQSNTRALSKADPKKQSQMAKTFRPLGETLHAKPWVITLFPTQAYAQDADMNLTEFEDFVYAATFSDCKDPVAEWKKVQTRQARLIARIQGASTIRILSPDTDLQFSVRGRRFVNSAGKTNMPSGEIFTGPVETSAEGHITFDFPASHSGREISGIRLVFRKGNVVEASAEKNEAFLNAMLNTDAGARRLGELGIGTNFAIQKFIRSILFDEKIGGTIHLALGRSIAGTGGKNQSAIHWDMIKDLRKEGTLFADNRPFLKNGRFM